MAKRGNPNWANGKMKGKSGNPKGRPAGYADFASRMRELSDSEAFTVLKARLLSDDERISFDAAKFIVERGYGKSLENVRVGMDDDLASLLASARERMKQE